MHDAMVTAYKTVKVPGVWVNGSIYWAPEMASCVGHVVQVRYWPSDPTVVGIFSDLDDTFLYNAYRDKEA